MKKRHWSDDARLLPASAPPQDLRSIRSETRASLIASIRRGRRWLDEIVAGAVTSVEQIAAHDKLRLNS
jgi:site-specific DNA recombinase